MNNAMNNTMNTMLMQRNKALNLSTSMLTMTTSQTNLIRDELEDKFFRLKDEHLELKKEANNAEYHMKYLNAKLTRLLNEKKRLLNKEKTRREIDLEELIFDLQQKLTQSDRENVRLREKTLVLRTQLEAEIGQKRVTSAYSHVQSRTDSGLGSNFRPLNTRTSSALVLNRRPTTTESNKVSSSLHYSKLKTVSTSTMPLFAFNLLQEAQEEIKKLEEVVAMQQSHIETLHLQSDRFSTNHTIHNSSLNTNLKKAIDMSQDSNGFSHTDSDSSRPKEQTLKKHNQLLNHHSSGKRISEDISNLIEKLQRELSIEKTKCSEMRRKLLEESVIHRGHEELDQRIQTLEKENEILRKSLEQCIGSCMTEIGQNFEENPSKRDDEYEHELQMQISDLRSELSRVQNELHNEKSKFATLSSQHQKLQAKYNSVQLKLEELEIRTQTSNTLTRDTSVRNECNRSDHLELSQQLLDMQTERQQLLTEFEDMKEMLQLIQNSITSDE